MEMIKLFKTRIPFLSHSLTCLKCFSYFTCLMCLIYLIYHVCHNCIMRLGVVQSFAKTLVRREGSMLLGQNPKGGTLFLVLLHFY